ncbi:oxidoreductase [Citrobacter freundii]|nr:oxidoreductase [Citrobacter freundii]
MPVRSPASWLTNGEQHVLSHRHFQPRITVIKHQQQRSAVTCHHCEDAPCARSCPNGAISHVNDSVQVNPKKCIGCKSCVVACPFGTMQIVLTPVAKGKVKATAHKCDLCQGREQGPACVENCPAQAFTTGDGNFAYRLVKSAQTAHRQSGKPAPGMPAAPISFRRQ